MTEPSEIAHEDTKTLPLAVGATPDFEGIGRVIVDVIFKLHTTLGRGLLESVYEQILFRELSRRRLKVERQRPISFTYEGQEYVDAFRVDLLVDSAVLVEIKSVETLLPVHSKQLLTYLRLMNLPLGFLMNFGAATIKQGLRRVVNGEVPSASSCLRVQKFGGSREDAP
ncbi:MAG: GxxExxY protein [Alphaproteobacteria bacterium]